MTNEWIKQMDFIPYNLFFWIVLWLEEHIRIKDNRIHPSGYLTHCLFQKVLEEY